MLILFGCIGLFVLSVVGAWKCGRKFDGLPAAFAFSVLVCIFGILAYGGLFLVSCRSFGGFDPNYGSGTMSGYVVQLRYGGLIWKTWDGVIQRGVGEQAAVEKTVAFSVADQQVAEQLLDLVGKRVLVRLTYDEWFMAPYRVGASDLIVTRLAAGDVAEETE